MPSAMLSEIAFPVLCLAQDNSINVCPTAEALQECSATAFFRNGYFLELKIIDSTFAQYCVVKAELGQPLTGLRRWFTQLLNRRLFVRLHLERLPQSSPGEAKEAISHWLKRAPGHWEATRSIEAWHRRIESASQMNALLALFA